MPYSYNLFSSGVCHSTVDYRVTLHWNPPDVLDGTITFDVYRDNVLIDSVVGTPVDPIITYVESVPHNTAYDYRVESTLGVSPTIVTTASDCSSWVSIAPDRFSAVL